MISVVILTKNEEKNIVDCIDSVAWVDEIIIVDDYSTDKTVDIIKRLKNDKIKLFQRSLAGDFSSQRNFGMSKASEDWILFIDADERVSSVLQFEISHVINSLAGTTAAGYQIKRIDTMWGKKLLHGETGSIYLTRLVKKGMGEWYGKVHEQLKVIGGVEDLQRPLYHYPHQTLTEFLKEVNYYTDLRAQELYEKKTKAYWWSIIAYPKAKFFINYFLKRGFLDGTPGLVVAIIMSLHSFLVRGKLWLLWNKNTAS